MPPRLRSSTLSSSCTSSPFSSCTSVRPQSIAQPAQASRQFSHTPCHQITLRRRKFYEWLNGPGRQLKEPLPGSTNYLGAYDKYGNLVRAGPGWRRGAQKASDQEQLAALETKEGNPSTDATPTGQENLDELEAAIRSGEAEEKDAKLKGVQEDDDRLPPETAEDLRPFPLNQYFRSQPVLSEELREAIYQRVKKDGATVSLASVEFGVSNERVGAVVRLKQMEKEWIAQGKTLALPYSKAVLDMLPTTPHIDSSLPANKGKRPITHEPINDLIVHPATRQQLFVPVAESRHFTRVDAGKAFDNNLLPADARIPHPELVHAERELATGLSFEERKKLAEARYEAEQKQKRKMEAKKAEELRALKVVPQRRWDFVFKDISVEAAGRDGRGAKAEGWRYGVPHQDRKRGIPKIPTKVEA
ncbi:eukaryotic mitochondrial regulator protein-domain-containing protein [Pyrenochaeta sp. MPI-SDFR-AT-0127]|nr:eukaryotic mitochondrial regulator protein-domain-containing protein [Pyrenochaeta sp. MPI-SDFR-AT-0127]